MNKSFKIYNQNFQREVWRWLKDFFGFQIIIILFHHHRLQETFFINCLMCFQGFFLITKGKDNNKSVEKSIHYQLSLEPQKATRDHIFIQND